MLNRRRKILVDQQVQGALVRRIMVYWFICVSGMFCVLAGLPVAMSWWMTANGPTISSIIRATWIDFWPSLIASLVMLPFILGDVLRLSHRFVGPVFRFRGVVRDLANGQNVAPIKLRDGDYWTDFADELNRLADRLRASSAERRVGEPAAADAEETLPV